MRLSRSRITILPALCVLLAIAPLSALAQGAPLTVQQGSLRLWPEYDDPGLLVIFSGNFTSATTFPQQVAFPVPAGSHGIQATMMDATGQLFNQSWQIVEGNLTYTLPQPGFHIEYYVDRPPSGNQRELSYTFQASYAMQELEITVQQPTRATDFSMTPRPESSYQGTDGFTYYRIVRANLAAGDKIPITIRYTKTDQGFSVMPSQAQSNAQTAQKLASQPTTTRNTTWIAWGLIVLGMVVLLGVAIYWLVTRQREIEPAYLAPDGTRSRISQQSGPSRARDMIAYCTQCGRQLGPADRFCANCGTPRRNKK